MKKNLGVLILGMFLISMFAGFVSARERQSGEAFTSVQNAVEAVYKTVQPVLEKVIGDTDTSEFFFAKVLFLIIIFAIVWKSMERIPFFSSSDNSWVLWVVSISVSILAIRWFGNVEIIKTAILPYSVLGIAVSAGIPFVLAFLIIEGLKPTMRKVGWIFFAVVFVFLWVARIDELGQFGNIYLATAGIALLALFMDGTIQRLMSKMKVERTNAYHLNKMAGDLRDEMKKFTNRYKEDGENYISVYDSSITGNKGWEKDMEEIKRQITTLQSH